MRQCGSFSIFARRLCCFHSAKHHLFTSRHSLIIHEVVRNIRYPYLNFSTRASGTATPPSISETNIELDKISELSTSNDFDQIVSHPVFSDCSSNLRDFDDDAVLKLCYLLGQIRVKFGSLLYDDDEVLRSVARKIDKELCRRCRSVDDANQLAKFLQAFVSLPKQTVYDFGLYVIRTRLKRVLRLPTPMMLKFMRLFNEMNLWHVYHVEKYRIQFATLHHLPHLGVNDLAHLIRSMVVLRHRITTPNLFEQIFDLFVREFPSVTVDTLNVFVRFFKLNVHKFRCIEGKDQVLKLLTLVHPMIDSLSLQDLTHIMNLLTYSNCCDRVFFEKFAFRFTSELSESMIMKEHFLRGVDALTAFNINFDSVDRYSRLFTELKAEPLTILHNQPKKVVIVASHLSRIGIYDYDLLEIIFSRGFLLDTYKKLIPLAVPFHVYTLNESVSLDCPDYQGKKLPENLRKAFLKLIQSRVERKLQSRSSSIDVNDQSLMSHRPHEEMLFDMRLTLASLLGGFEYVHVGNPLSHLNKSNVIFCLKDRVPQVLSADVDLLSGDLKQCTWYSFSFYRRNIVPSSDELLLIFDGAMEKRHMEKLGYRTLPIVIGDWKNFNSGEKKGYLKKLIFEE